jgi:hypothetical protein
MEYIKTAGGYMNSLFIKHALLAICASHISSNIHTMELPHHDQQHIIHNTVKSKRLSLMPILLIPTLSPEVKECTRDFINDVYKYLAATSNQIFSSFITYPFLNLSQPDLHTITMVPHEGSLATRGTSIKYAFKQLINNKDTIDINIRDSQKNLQLQLGIKPDHINDYFVLYSRGFGYYSNLMDGLTNQGIGLIQCYKYYRDNIIHCPCFLFDYPASLFTLNFGQYSDQKCLQTVYQQIQNQNSSAHGIVLGLSMGAHTALRWIANYHPTNISAVILESPFISLDDTLDTIVESKLPLQKCPQLCKTCIETAFIGFTKKNDCLIAETKKFPSNIPLLVIHLKDEKVISNDAINSLIDSLKTTGNPDIYFLVIADPTHKLKHGKLSSSKIFQQVANAFMATYNLPCNKSLALEGQSSLKLAKENYQIDLSNQKLHIVEEHP